MSYYQKKWGYKLGDFPITEDISNNLLSLPIYPQLSKEDQKHIIDKIGQYFMNL